MSAQKTLSGRALPPTALAGSMDEKPTVEEHQAPLNSSELRRPATALLMEFQSAPRPKAPVFNSFNKSAAVALAGGSVMRRTTAENDSPARRVAFSRL